MNTLILDVKRLRQNCPWYQGQTFETTRGYLLEEFQEVLQALDDDDPAALKEELGDLLFQIVLFSELASERGWFSVQDLMNDLHRKIVDRNQHVFGDLILKDIDEVNRNWQFVKSQKKDKENMDYQISIENDQAIVSWKNNPAVTISLEPPPAEKFTPGYTRSAWVWCALNDVFDAAQISVPDHDLQDIATQIANNATSTL